MKKDLVTVNPDKALQDLAHMLINCLLVKILRRADYLQISAIKDRQLQQTI